MRYYFFILISAMLFSGQFLFQQGYQGLRGSSFSSAMAFAAHSGLTVFLIMLAINGFQIQFSWLSFLIASIYACVNIILSCFSLRALKTANLSLFSMFAMLGGMLLPFGYGILLCGEDLGLKKFIGCLLILAALTLTIDPSKMEKETLLSYILVFILNGIAGMISKFHQSLEVNSINSQSFMGTACMMTFVISTLIFRGREGHLPKPGVCGLKYTAGYALFWGVGNLLVLIALKHIPASVQFPAVTGGVIVFSTILSLVRRENVGKREMLSAGTAFLSTVFIL